MLCILQKYVYRQFTAIYSVYLNYFDLMISSPKYLIRLYESKMLSNFRPTILANRKYNMVNRR